jgi:hypothetical protein
MLLASHHSFAGPARSGPATQSRRRSAAAAAGGGNRDAQVLVTLGN